MKRGTLKDAQLTYDSRISKYKSPPYEGLGQAARVEPRGSARRPYLFVIFIRANVVVHISQQGKDPADALAAARVIDKKIEDNLK